MEAAVFSSSKSFTSFARVPRSPASTTTKASQFVSSKSDAKAAVVASPASRTRTRRRPPSIESCAASSARRAGSLETSLPVRLATRKGSERSSTIDLARAVARSRTRLDLGLKTRAACIAAGGCFTKRSMSPARSFMRGVLSRGANGQLRVRRSKPTPRRRRICSASSRAARVSASCSALRVANCESTTL